MTDPIDLAHIANFDPIDTVEDDDWFTIAGALTDAMKARLNEYGRGII